MANYTVKLSAAPKGHAIPPLLADVGAWVGQQPHGSLGGFDALTAEAIPTEWSPEHSERLRREAFAFLGLPDGSLLVLVNAGAKAPPAVGLLGSEGEIRTVANSLEEFLHLWSRGETDIHELDDEDGASGRKALAAWLKAKKVKVPKAKDFDFAAWLDGGRIAEAPAVAVPGPSSAGVMQKLGPKTQRLASILGRRADDPEVIAYVTEVLGKKVPPSTTENNDAVNVAATKHGVELVFSHDILNEAWPPVPKTGKTFIPYVSYAWVRSKIGEPVLGVPWKVASEAELTQVLGPPTGRRAAFTNEDELTVAYWTHPLDTAGHLRLELAFDGDLSVTLAVESAGALERYPDVTTGLFVGYAATRGLLDSSRFEAHRDLFAAVQARKAKGSELVARALSRGLWDDHLRDAPGLRTLAWRWFHNMCGFWMTADLNEVFGKRKGPFGHDEPKLDDDTWDAVDTAAKLLDQRFAAWLTKPG
ncbi:hypothetical protein HPC49_45400 [Pyxidicoccus fallax]|uniref:Uncharacterized protein n=1 Tax=Pyxidicoccus fallax TaxID=394095 RepID=A0A848LY03_9BACT|nr:hypothetical protein [Pyxidicoccus fallax]NMO22955.1 hypothetical protein [Pyxidicoccus fallax]NPC85418.1 hypothetical protein [Pyxidicoccus fallax]